MGFLKSAPGLFEIGTMDRFSRNGFFEIATMDWSFSKERLFLKWTFFSATALSGWCVMLVRYVRLCESRPLSVLGSFCVFHASSFCLHDAFHKALLDP